MSIGSDDVEAKSPSFIEVGKTYRIYFTQQWFSVKIKEVENCWISTSILESQGHMDQVETDKMFKGYLLRLNICSAWGMSGPFEAEEKKEE
jgi:hypothetical protein